LTDFIDTSELTTALTPYLKTGDLGTSLSTYNYIDTTELTTALSPYFKTADLAFSLSGYNYIDTGELTTALSPYFKTGYLGTLIKLLYLHIIILIQQN
jgi:hypothetical protein